MNDAFHSHLLTLLFTSSVISGCSAHRVCFKPVGNLQLTPATVAKNKHEEDQVVSWGGIVTEETNNANELEVIAYPLDSCGQPEINNSPLGRFRVRHHHFNSMDIPVGRQLTATGRLRELWQTPLLDEAAVRLWPEPLPVNDPGYPIFIWPFISIGISGGGGRIGGGIGIHF
ncbi:hypothetical protein CKO09_08865 [Chromatium weissei]|nr:hypothetical protein [Chromatium weissei]